MSRRMSLAVLTTLAALVLAACSSSTASWTFEPAPPSTPVPSVSASVPAGGSAGASESASAPAASAGSESPAASGGQAGATLDLTAQNIQFDKAALDAPAGQAFALKFSNQDAGVPHDVVIKDASGADVFKGEIVTGPADTTYQVPALQAGTYTFYCSVHPNMTGTLTAK
ncbi:MAG TPA: cupredoxin domain-containing protein [Candidatus Limnocylindrales bacterium]